MEEVVRIEGRALASDEVDASVFVVTRSGELVEAADYVFEAFAGNYSGR